MKLHDLKQGVQVEGIIPQQRVTVVDVKWHGLAAVGLTYKHTAGAASNQLLIETETQWGWPLPACTNAGRKL